MFYYNHLVDANPSHVVGFTLALCLELGLTTSYIYLRLCEVTYQTVREYSIVHIVATYATPWCRFIILLQCSGISSRLATAKVNTGNGIETLPIVSLASEYFPLCEATQSLALCVPLLTTIGKSRNVSLIMASSSFLHFVNPFLSLSNTHNSSSHPSSNQLQLNTSHSSKHSNYFTKMPRQEIRDFWELEDHELERHYYIIRLLNEAREVKDEQEKKRERGMLLDVGFMDPWRELRGKVLGKKLVEQREGGMREEDLFIKLVSKWLLSLTFHFSLKVAIHEWLHHLFYERKHR